MDRDRAGRKVVIAEGKNAQRIVTKCVDEVLVVLPGVNAEVVSVGGLDQQVVEVANTIAFATADDLDAAPHRQTDTVPGVLAICLSKASSSRRGILTVRPGCTWSGPRTNP